MKRNGFALVALLSALIGCGSHGRPHERNPEFSAGEGAISGKLVGTDKEPFDLSLAGEGGVQSLQIKLLGPATGIAAATYPRKDKSTFIFSHVKPGRYEISIYGVVTGKRTIAGSSPVNVNPEQITPITLTLTVTPMQNGQP